MYIFLLLVADPVGDGPNPDLFLKKKENTVSESDLTCYN